MDASQFHIKIPPHFVIMMWLYLAAISAAFLCLGYYGMQWSKLGALEMLLIDGGATEA